MEAMRPDKTLTSVNRIQLGGRDMMGSIVSLPRGGATLPADMPRTTVRAYLRGDPAMPDLAARTLLSALHQHGLFRVRETEGVSDCARLISAPSISRAEHAQNPPHHHYRPACQLGHSCP